MIQISVSQLLNAVPALQAIVQQPHQGASAFAIRRLVTKVQSELINACAARDTLLTDENSTVIRPGVREIKPESVASFAANPLFAVIINLDCEPLTPGLLSAATITVAQIDSLGPLLVD